MTPRPHNLPLLLALLLLSATLPACQSSQKPAKTCINPPFYVPTAAIRQPLNPPSPTQQLAYNRAHDILPASDADNFYAPRAEPFAYGPTFLGGMSAYTDYTFDAERISTPGNSGWRYRYVVRQGVSFP